MRLIWQPVVQIQIWGNPRFSRCYFVDGLTCNICKSFVIHASSNQNHSLADSSHLSFFVRSCTFLTCIFNNSEIHEKIMTSKYNTRTCLSSSYLSCQSLSSKFFFGSKFILIWLASSVKIEALYDFCLFIEFLLFRETGVTTVYLRLFIVPEFRKKLNSIFVFILPEKLVQDFNRCDQHKLNMNARNMLEGIEKSAPPYNIIYIFFHERSAVPCFNWFKRRYFKHDWSHDLILIYWFLSVYGPPVDEIWWNFSWHL